MQFLFVTILLLASAVSPLSTHKRWDLAQFDLKPYDLTQMYIECTKHPKGTLSGCFISFAWNDPNAGQNCTCLDYWQWDGISPVWDLSNDRGNLCKSDANGTFRFNFLDVFSLSNFSLQLTHTWRDTKFYPFPMITNWIAQPNITLPMTQESNSSIVLSAGNSSIKATINGMYA
ncbi:hypothetical protein GGR54DRAFT_637034 [Hypoxylon sp. NC1633]|nr:hypothetical protein GGR54DRAFT_637034 [Hypoxylon sp. NC1633]